MASSVRRASMLLFKRMTNLPQRSSLRTIYSVTKRPPNFVNYQLPRALSALHPAVKEEFSNGNGSESGDFSKFRLSQETVELLKGKNIHHLFPIQSETFDYVYDGKDVIAQARTGTGKTLSFVLPLIEKLKSEDHLEGQGPKVLVLAPTRELCKQIGDEFDYFKLGLKVCCVYGGVPYGPQAEAIRNGLDIVVGTPGRLMDHTVNGGLDLTNLKYVVIDEVDRMLDMGFADVVEDMLKESYNNSSRNKPQTLLYSATLPPWVRNTARKYMSKDRKVVDLIGDQSLKAAETVEHLAISATRETTPSIISDIVQVYCGAHSRTLIFTETKNEASHLGLNSILKQDAQVLHGDIKQEQREITLKSFRDGRVRCLVATDVAARGLDIPEVDLVVLTQPPKDLDMYIHRSGRTGRAGRKGMSIVIYNKGQESLLRAVEKQAGIKFKHIAPPSVNDVIQASASDALKFVEDISPDVVEKFRDAAQALVEKLGAVDAVAAALAHISNTKEIKSRSLLTGQEGFSTYLLRSPVEMNGTGYMWSTLKTFPEIHQHLRVMRICQDGRGVVIDVPDNILELVEDESFKYGTRRISSVEKITELPDLKERPQRFEMGERRPKERGYGGRESFRRESFRRDPMRESSRFGRTTVDYHN